MWYLSVYSWVTTYTMAEKTVIGNKSSAASDEIAIIATPLKGREIDILT